MNTMQDKMYFQIRALSIEEGFELSCEGAYSLGPMRLIDAVIHATQMAEHHPATIQIFDGDGQLVETIDLNSPSVIHHYLSSVCMAA